MIIVTILLILIASLADAIMDTISSHFTTSIFSNIFDWKILKNKTKEQKVKIYKWLNPYYSWKNKWKNGDKSQGEAFKFSSSLFVLITDCWHLMQSIQLTTLFIFAFTFYNTNGSILYNIIALCLYRVLYGLHFTYWYEYKLKLKKDENK